MFSFANKKSKKTKTVLVVDISSSSVGAGLSTMPTDAASTELPVSLAFVRNSIPMKEHFEVSHFLETTLKYLDATLQSLQHTCNIVPDEIQCVLSSPWFVSHTRSISYTELTPFMCTQKLVNSLIDAELKKLEQSEGNNAMLTIEQQISQCTLNGYATNSPFGKKASSLVLGLSITQSPTECIERFNTLMRRSYGDVHISYTTMPFALSIVMRDQNIIDSDAIVLSVGEQITDIGFIKDHSFLYQHSFPVGMYNLFHIMHESGVPRGQANTLLDGYKLGLIHDEKRLSVENALHMFSKDWSTGLDGVLAHGYFGFATPAKCVILCDTRFALFFQTLITQHPLLRHTSALDKISCSFVTPLTFAGRITNGPLDITPDSVGLLMTLFSRLHHGSAL